MAALSRCRLAFTLIELLVVIAIISLLMALLLPAIQKVRAAADKMKCGSNLRQIGIALHNYHNDYLRFPSGYTTTQTYIDGATDCSPGWGWSAMILPYLEQDNVHKAIDFSLPITASQNQAAIANSIALYRCPSDELPSRSFAVTNAGNATLAIVGPSSYAATCGPDETECTDPTGLGVFFRNSKIRITDIKDGTSNTVLVGDRDWQHTNGTWVGAINNGVVRAGQANVWKLATADAPCFVLVHNNWINITTDADGGLDDFSSMHVGGVNLLFGDGSVRFIHSITIDGQDRYDFWGLGTRNGGEVVQTLDY